jgi:hypothetical protein
VAVVALTVCGVAVGMVAAGMESKNVPTLKYTPGTKTTYNHVIKAGMGSNGDMNMGDNTMAVEQYVLNTDASGATTFLVNIPVVMNVELEGETSEAPIASYVITQASNGVVDWADIKTNVPDTSEFYDVAAKVLVHHMSMVSPRLAKDATVSEIDTVIAKQVDAKYTVNNLEEGTTEVVRTVAPAGVANQVNGQQLYAAASKTVTMKDGEVIAAKSSGASETSTYFEKKGTADGEVGYYRDSRTTYTHDATMTKAATEAFDLAEFAKELSEFTAADLKMYAEEEYEPKAPFVVGTGMEGTGESDEEADDQAEEARSLLAWTIYTKKGSDSAKSGSKFTFSVVLDFVYSGPGGSKSCEQRGDTYYNQCSAKRGFTVSFKVSLELVAGTFSFTLSWGKTKETNPGNNIKKSTGWTVVIAFSTKGYSASWTLMRANVDTNEDCDKSPPEVGTPKVPLPGMSVGPLGLQFQVFFQGGYNISPGMVPSKKKTSGYGCVKQHSTYARRYKNTGKVWNKYDYRQWWYLPETWLWDSKAYPSLMGFMAPGKYRKYRYYVQLGSYFYSGSGCSLKYSTSRTRFVVFATFTAYMEVGIKAILSSGKCLGWRKWAIKYEAGCTVTGRFWSVSITGGVYLLLGAGDCWYMTYAQNAATLTIELFFNQKYSTGCKKTKGLFGSIISKFKYTWKGKQTVSDHLKFWSYPWLVYPCMSSNPGDCNPKSNNFTKVWLYSGACHSDSYMLEPHYGGRKQFYTYK